jgi:hypothetical protein
VELEAIGKVEAVLGRESTRPIQGRLIGERLWRKVNATAVTIGPDELRGVLEILLIGKATSKPLALEDTQGLGNAQCACVQPDVRLEVGLDGVAAGLVREQLD